MVLTWGTNNISLDGFDEYRNPQLGTEKEYIKWDLDEEIRRRENGSKLVLGARVVYVAFIWWQKFCITEFHRKLHLSFWNTSYKGVLGAIRWLLVVTFIGAVVSIFAECHPFRKYWQVLPDPGPRCRQAISPLIVMAVCNAVTDLVIVVFPLPPILITSMPFKKRFFLILSLSLSLFTCALAVYRVPFVLRYHASQPHRTLYASLECLASCTIANAIVLNSFFRDKGPKRNKYRGPGGAHMVYSPEAIAKRGRTKDQEALYALDEQSTRMGMRLWGSDEDLVKDTGVGMNGDLRKMSDAVQRHSLQSTISVLESSDMDTRSHAEGSQGCPPWMTAWEDHMESWREGSESGSGRELILPPPPPPVATSEHLLKPWDYQQASSRSYEPRMSGNSISMPKPPQGQNLGESSSSGTSASLKTSFLDVGGLLGIGNEDNTKSKQ